MRRAPRKTDAERGPLGAWAYHAMDDLGLSDAQIAIRVGVSAGRVRKIMGGSEREPSARLLRAMHRYFMEVGAAADPPIPIDRPPGLEPDDHTAGAGGDTTQPVPAAYLERIDALIGQLAADRKLIQDLVDELRLARAEAEGYADAVREIESQGPGAPADDPVDGPPADAPHQTAE